MHLFTCGFNENLVGPESCIICLKHASLFSPTYNMCGSTHLSIVLSRFGEEYT